MAHERFKLIAAVYLLLMDGDRILLLRRYNTGYADGQYSLIAGHIDGVEPLRMAMVREAVEEAGILIEPSALDLVHVLHRLTPGSDGSPDERVEFFFTLDRWEGSPRIMEPDKCDDLSWFSLDEMPAETLDYIRHVVRMVQEWIAYSEYGWTARRIGKQWIRTHAGSCWLREEPEGDCCDYLQRRRVEVLNLGCLAKVENG